MLRRRLSTGLLRAASPSPSPITAAPICHVSPSKQRSRGLASAVLLNSQRNWKAETVAVLKQELKKRGLSQQGNKSTLISRLESAETSSLLGPLPPFPTGARSLSTTSFVAQPPKSKTVPTAPPPPSDSDVNVVAPGVTSTGPQVSSQGGGAVVPDKVAPEQVTVAPGLPESKLAAVSGGEVLDIRIPGPRPDAEIDQIIPFAPDNFQSNSALPTSTPASSDPKIITVASASTHPAGGPTHGIYDGTDAHTLESLEGAASSSIPSLGAFGLSVLRAPVNAWRSLGLGLPEVGLPSVGGSGEYKYEKRPLDEHERVGAWVLAGVVATGLVLGGSKGENKEKHGEHGPVGSSKEASKVKGDAKWEQASGAGVVGHGSRKD